jgi:diphthamide biosynthesis methyltransferase
MLYLVGLGLADEKDITVKGLEVVKKAERVYLEAYTAVLLVEKDVLVSCYLMAGNRAQLIVTTVGSLLWPRSHHSRP